MFVLDTNHLRELAMGSEAGLQIERRLRQANEDPVTTIASAEEVLRGRLAKLSSARVEAEQVLAAERLAASIQFLAGLPLLPWDFEAAERFRMLRQTGIRIGTLDLKIACITLEHDAVLLTRNTVDFAKVPGLQFENWVD